MPHAALDLLRGCNVRCDHCYNTAATACKPFEQLSTELDLLTGFRNLDMLTLTGGEPLLHPDLERVVRLVKSRNIHPVVLTNGLLLDDAKAASLAEAGCTMVIVHIQEGQQRGDLPDADSSEAVARLRSEKAALITRHNMIAGLSVTLPPDDLPFVRRTFTAFAESPDFEYLLCTVARDISCLAGWHVTIDKATPPANNPGTHAELFDASGITGALEQSGMAFFSWLGGFVYPDRPRWMAFAGVQLRGTDAVLAIRPMPPSLFEWCAMRLFKRLAGRWPVIMKHTTRQTRTKLLFNALTGGNIRNLALTFRSFGRRRLIEKHVLFEQFPEVIAPGVLEFCGDCIDATVQDGKLIPACLADINRGSC